MAINIVKPHFSESSRRQIAEGIDRVLASGQLMMGEFTDKFEDEFAAFVGTESAVTVNTCTTALQICLQYFDVKGSEVLIPAGGFLTDLSAVIWAGGTPVLVDIDPDTLALDLDDLERKRTAKTKCIIWVHLTGVISHNYQEIKAYAERHDLFLLEDAAHAHGAEIDGHKAGTIGHAGCFSFFPTKVITSGTGGMITTDDPALVRYAKEVRLLGRDIETGDIVRVGNDWFMDEIRACVAYYQFQELGQFLERRRVIAERYRQGFANQPGLRLLPLEDGNLPAYYQFVVHLDPSIDRDGVGNALKEKHGIGAKRIYIPLHQEEIFKQYDDGTLKRSEEALNHSLCLPMHFQLTDDDVDQVIAATIGEVRDYL
jgi:perosamine synthetase